MNHTYDRRSGIERRAINRYQVDLSVEWEGPSGRRHAGSISDVSLDGCFVLCTGDVDDGEAVRLFLPLDDGMKVEFAGVVANHVVEIGFGMRFNALTAEQRDILIRLVQDKAES